MTHKLNYRSPKPSRSRLIARSGLFSVLIAVASPVFFRMLSFSLFGFLFMTSLELVGAGIAVTGLIAAPRLRWVSAVGLAMNLIPMIGFLGVSIYLHLSDF